MTFDVKKVAERYAASAHTVLHWIDKNELRAINVSRTCGGRPRWRITAEALAEFESARAATPAVAPATRKKRKRQKDDVIEFYPSR